MGQADDGSVAARAKHGARADQLVVLLVHPALGADVGRGQKGSEDGRRVGRLGDSRRVERLGGQMGGPLGLEGVARGLGQVGHGKVAHLEALPVQAQAAVTGQVPDRRAGQLVPGAGGLDLGQAPRLDDGQHPLLRLGDHDLERLHALLAPGDEVEVEACAHLAAGGHLGHGRGQARRAQVLQRDDEAGARELEGALEELLARERVAHLDRRALLLASVVEVLRGEDARPADAVAAGGGPVEDEEVALADGAGADERLGPKDAEAERVHERVLAVGGVEDGLAAHVGHPDAVSVAPDAAHDPAEELAWAGLVERAEAQGVEDGNRSCAHGEDVAQDAAHAGGRALEGLHRGGMVVALDLEGHGPAVARVDDPCVLPRALKHARPLGGEAAQLEAGVLVPAVLRPQQREHGELQAVRLAAEALEDLGVLSVREPERPVQRLSDRRRHGADEPW